MPLPLRPGGPAEPSLTGCPSHGSSSAEAASTPCSARIASSANDLARWLHTLLGAGVAQAMAFYAHIGKRPIQVRREIKGHIANRLQAALWREAFHLVNEGVATVSDIDTAIAQGPGLRWALMGPFMNLHLSGGEGGIAHLLAHLGGPIEDWWRDLGAPSMDAALQHQVVDGVAQALGTRQAAELARARDALLIELLRAKQSSGALD